MPRHDRRNRKRIPPVTPPADVLLIEDEPSIAEAVHPDRLNLLAEAQALIPYALALSAASFLYIAFGDLLPRIHGQTDRRQRQWQYLMLVLGMAGIALIRIHHG